MIMIIKKKMNCIFKKRSINEDEIALFPGDFLIVVHLLHSFLHDIFLFDHPDSSLSNPKALSIHGGDPLGNQLFDSLSSELDHPLLDLVDGKRFLRGFHQKAFYYLAQEIGVIAKQRKGDVFEVVFVVETQQICKQQLAKISILENDFIDLAFRVSFKLSAFVRNWIISAQI